MLILVREILQQNRGTILLKNIIAITFIAGTSIVFAGGTTNQSSNNSYLSDIYGQYKISYGSIDFSLYSGDAISSAREGANYLPVEFEAWVGKKLSSDLEGIVRLKYAKYNTLGQKGTTGPDDTPNKVFSAEGMLIKDYSNFTSYSALQYIRSREFAYRDRTSAEVYHTLFHGSLGGVYSHSDHNSSFIGFGIASTSDETSSSAYVDEIIYLQLGHNIQITQSLDFTLQHTEYQYEKKHSESSDRDGREYQYSEAKFNYRYHDYDLGLKFGRIDNNGPDFEHAKADTYMFSISVPFGSRSSKRTGLIINNRPDIEFMNGFTAGPTDG
jgi:hypothetical protein